MSTLNTGDLVETIVVIETNDLKIPRGTRFTVARDTGAFSIDFIEVSFGAGTVNIKKDKIRKILETA